MPPLLTIFMYSLLIITKNGIGPTTAFVFDEFHRREEI